MTHPVMRTIVHNGRKQRQPNRNTSDHCERLGDPIIAGLGVVVNSDK